MKIIKSNAIFSAIIGIGGKLKKLSKETGKEYLFLNRGVNSVCNIDLREVVKTIDFNSDDIQVYPLIKGRIDLREAINNVYFGGKSTIENISITGGGMSGLDIAFQTLNIENIYLSSFYWGPYFQIMTIRKIQNEVYENFEELHNNLDKLKNSAVVICDPNNPLGDKYDDVKLFELIKLLNNNGTIVIIDSPYRRVFYDDTDTFYQDLLKLKNVIIVESFSKSVGLSGQRIGFVHTTNEEFNTEFNLRAMYVTNGINAFSQILIQKLLTTQAGIKAVNEFKKKTVNDIQLNINYLEDNNLLAKEFYSETKPIGIFVIVNKSEEELLKHQIGSVSLSYFTRTKKEDAKKYARICVSIPHKKFKEFFSNFA